MELAGYFAAVFIGIALGLIGGGGSILTVPVLVYLFSIDAVLATAYSLFIVGATSLVGSFTYFKKGLVNIRTAIVFGIPSILAVFLTRAYIVPALPDPLFTLMGQTISKSMFLMLLFALLMIMAAYSMIRKQTNGKLSHAAEGQKFNYPLIFLEGTVVGILTGLVGAGGGFLIIPALIFLSKLSMKEAVGTSLVIIAAKSLIGFFGEGNETVIDWLFLGKITAFAVLGIWIGARLSHRIDGSKLKPVFGWFVLIMGIYIILRETVL